MESNRESMVGQPMTKVFARLQAKRMVAGDKK